MSKELNKQHVHDLLQRVVDEEFPGRDDLLPDIMARARALRIAEPAPAPQPRQSARAGERRQGFRPLATGLVTVTALAGLLAYAVFGAGLWGNPPPVTAAEIVARVEQAAGDPSSFGLRSLHGTYIEASVPESGQERVDLTQEAWFMEPAQLRVVTQQPDASQDQAMIMIGKDTTIWQYARGETRGTVFHNAMISGFFTTQSLDQWLTQWKQMSLEDEPLAVVAEDRVLGRPAYVLEGKDGNVEGQRVKLWVDQEFYLLLRKEIYSESRRTLLGWGGFTSLELNVPVDDQLFVLPPEVTFEEMQTSVNETGTGASSSYADAPFAVFEPEFVPGLSEQDPQMVSGENHFDEDPPWLTLNYMLVGETTTSESAGTSEVFAEITPLFQIKITPASDDAVCGAAELALGGVEVALGEHRGCAYTDPDPSRGKTIALTREGSRIVVSAGDSSMLSMQDLEQVAASLKRVN